jgi:hypothetical protein
MTHDEVWGREGTSGHSNNPPPLAPTVSMAAAAVVARIIVSVSLRRLKISIGL